ncbi:NACHT domain-containing protein [Biscogniauxia sp. FL1348]|nr:NACHT domain-containing protein [Biscogniauxia sp. FL1348]
MAPKRLSNRRSWWRKRKNPRISQPELHDQVALPTTSTHAPEPVTTTLGDLSPTSAIPTPCQPVSSDTAALDDSRLRDRLWNKAYNDLKNEKLDLVDKYEKLLLREFGEKNSDSADETAQKNEIDQTNSEKRQSQMYQLVQAGLKKTEKEATVKGKIQDKMAYVLSIKGMIDTGIKAAPEAAIAWTGICFALEMLKNTIDETDANRKGIENVVSRMKWYWSLSNLLLEENIDDTSVELRHKLEESIVDLYKLFFSYQMESACSFYRNRGVVFLQDMVKLKDWSSNLDAIQEAENTFRRDYATYQTVTQRGLEEAEKNNQCLKDLRLTDPYGDKQRIKATKGGLLRDSSNWILEHNDFLRWRDDNEPRLLWIKGDPGKGKTMLMIAIADELEALANQSSSSSALSYFFCQGTNSNLNNATAVLRGLGYLLGIYKSSLVSHLRKGYDKSGKKLFEDENAYFALSEVLKQMLSDKSLSRVYIMIDALDECEEGLRDLLEFIVDKSSSLPGVKWIVSSRNKPEIEQYLKLDGSGTNLSLELTQNANQVATAVNAYIDYKVSSIPFLQREGKLMAQVKSTMQQNSAGTFLWAALVIQELETTKIWNVLDVLNDMPPGLDKLYERMMSQIRKLGKKDLQFCQQVLSAATLAYRPLLLDEIAVLSELPEEISNNVEYIQEIVAICGSFLTIRDDYVYLVHQSAKDYFLSDAGCSILFPSGTAQVHRDIFSRSVQAMSRLRRNIYDLDNPRLLASEIETPQPDPLRAIRYSCTHWISHFCDAHKSLEDDISVDEVDTIIKFIRDRFIYWLEALSLIRQTRNVTVLMTRLEKLLREQSSDHRLRLLVQDAHGFTLRNIGEIETAPLQTYSSALISGPTNCLIRRFFEKEAPETIRIKPILVTWTPYGQTCNIPSHMLDEMEFTYDMESFRHSKRT